MRLIPVIALVLSVFSVIVVFTKNTSAPKASNVAGRSFQEELQEIRQRLATLEESQSIDSLESAPNSNLEQEIAELAISQQELVELTKNIDPLGLIESTEREVNKSYAILMDETRTSWERAKQTEMLKRYGQFNDEAVDSMRQLWNIAEESNDKAAALFALRGYVTPEIRDEILAKLSVEGEGGGRKHKRLNYYSIEALEPLLPDQGVQTWLMHLVENDPMPKIANRAASAMGINIDWETSPKEK